MLSTQFSKRSGTDYVRLARIRYVTNGCSREMKKLPHDSPKSAFETTKIRTGKNGCPKTAKTSQDTLWGEFILTHWSESP